MTSPNPAIVRAGAARSGIVEPGVVLGSYQVLSKLASGGMGDVFVAEHVRLPRRVAIKVLKPELVVRPKMIERFFAEARLVNEIGHPNLVEIYDFVDDHSVVPSRVYVVMELLSGEDLCARLERRRLPVEETLWIADQVLGALEAVHEKQLVHRDLKPENIFLERLHDGSERVKLLDFGIAKAIGPRDGERLTVPGVALGTPAYMAPEQISGREIDARADLYATGVVLYTMLSGRLPFTGDMADLMAQHLRDLPPPLVEDDTADPLLEALDAVVLTCLQKDPARRFQSAVELRDALQAAALCAERAPTVGLHGEALPQEQPSGRPMRSPSGLSRDPETIVRRRQRRTTLAMGGLLLACCALALAAWWGSNREQPPAGESGSAAPRAAVAPRAASPTAGGAVLPERRSAAPRALASEGAARAGRSADASSAPGAVKPPPSHAAPRHARGAQSHRARRHLRSGGRPRSRRHRRVRVGSASERQRDRERSTPAKNTAPPTTGSHMVDTTLNPYARPRPLPDDDRERSR